MVKLFISHASADDPSQSAFVQSLNSKLRDDYGKDNVFFDQHSIECGDNWRARIFAGLGEADVGIIILGKKALDNSRPWVHTEATIMRWKQLMQNPAEHPFLLFVLLYGEDSVALFDNSPRWEPLQFGEVQLVKNGEKRTFDGTTFPPTSYDKIKQKISATQPACDQFGYSLFQQLLSKDLKKAHALGEDLSKSDLSVLVQPLIEDQLKALHQLLQANPGLYERPSIDKVLNRLSTLWVPHSACQTLAGVLEKEHKANRFALYCNDVPFTPECYLAQPKWLQQGKGWPYIWLSNLSGEMTLGRIRQSICTDLVKKLRLPNAFENDPAAINARLAELRLEIYPFFILIPDEFVHRRDDDVLGFITTHFSALNQILLLTNDTPLPDGYLELTSKNEEDGNLEQAPAEYRYKIELFIEQHA